MAKKGKKVQVSGDKDFKVDLWGNVSLGDMASGNNPIETFSKALSKTYRIKGRLLKSGKGLKPVTEIYEWPSHMTKNELNAILLKMKQSFGCGGTVKATHKALELQGDKFDQSKDYLKELGYILIRSGG